MPERRDCPFTRRRVLVAEGRRRRPSDWETSSLSPDDRSDCPFCEGHEAQTPPELWALRDRESEPDTPGWQVRVVPNKYPIAEPHELIVETPEHDVDLPDLPPAHVARVISAYQKRLRAVASQSGVRYPALFKNHGRAAGASRAHPHAQLVGLPFVPPLIQEELAIARASHEREGRCLYCATIERELASGGRIIEADEAMLVWSPVAARAAYECWVLPRRHRHDVRELSSGEIAALAEALQRALARLRTVLAHTRSPHAYNYYLHTTPTHTSPESELSYHWHVEILPRLGTPAGLEWGTGAYVNPVPPEEAARALRDGI